MLGRDDRPKTPALAVAPGFGNDHARMKPFALAAALLLAVSSHAATLVPGEAATGWILLFDGETTFGWTAPTKAAWRVDAGALVPPVGSAAGTTSSTTEFADFELRLEFKVEGRSDARLALRTPAGAEPTAANSTMFNLSRLADAADPLPASAGGWHSLEVNYQADRFTASLDGQLLGEAREKRSARGSIALVRPSGDGVILVRTIKLRPLGTQSLFNGTDLTGWKVIPEHKSVYSVTPEGWLNVKNGNGDLQTKRSFGDFILQLDVISHGDHLNSGVFFRAIPGEFWQGYESQIRNEWEGNDRTKPVDFGTGGIYRRQPARRVVSTDRTWFTKTIVAEGRHLAVWVDGIQVSDWTDPRPPHANPREGYRAQPGVISLQGHDPTTNLSFRNLRVAELPPAAGEAR